MKHAKKTLADFIKDRQLPLADILLPGPAFRLEYAGEPASFASVSGADDGSISMCEAAGLRLDSRVERVGEAAVIRHRLSNTRAEQSPPITMLEPLCLAFARPLREWRCLTAHGGTTENAYPPDAYRTGDHFPLYYRFRIESHPLGRSSNLHLPLMIALASAQPDSPGLFAGLEWSGEWYLMLADEGNETASLRGGVKVNGMRLDPHETLDLPAAHLGFFRGGREAGANALRRYLYEHVCPKYDSQPALPRVSYDHWFGIENDFDTELLKKEASRAAEIGVEVFVHDAAWFPGGFSDGVGNWNTTEPAKLPGGLKPLADYVRELGMDFGLWFEPECAVPGTWMEREHPDWFLGGIVHRKRRNLDLSRDDVQDFLIGMLGRWIEDLDIRWTRWDYNTEPKPFWDEVDPTGKIQFGYMKGLYRVLDTLMEKYPRWMVEGCASGGRRIDIGTIRRAHTFWFSDQTAMPWLCRYMQARANLFLPGHLCNSSVAVMRGQGDAGFDDAAALSRMLGKLAFDGDIASWSPEMARRMRGWATTFKEIRGLMAQDFYQLLPMPVNCEQPDAVEFAAYDGSEAAIFAFAGTEPVSFVLRLRGLRPDAQYRLEFQPTGASRQAAGSALMQRGVPVKIAPAGAVLMRAMKMG